MGVGGAIWPKGHWYYCIEILMTSPYGSYFQIGLPNADKEKLPHVLRWMDYIQVGPYPN